MLHKGFCANCYILNNSTIFQQTLNNSFWCFFFDSTLRKSTFQHFYALYYDYYNK
nr:MAG TPA: hypothetical protein [Microviridae sp.]